MSTTPQTTTDEKTTTAPLRFEIRAEWSTRKLEHDRDDPARLAKWLRAIPVDGEVTVDLEDTTATVLVETTPDEMDTSPGVLARNVRRVFRRYDKSTDGDDVSDVPLSPGLRPSHIRKAYHGEERPSGQQYVPPEVWQKAQEKVADLDLDLEGAENITPDITLRTLAGGEESHV